jgi:hypothetical protein
VNVEILGTWADTVDYLQALMKLDRGVRLTNVNVTVVGSEAEVGRRNSTLPPYAVKTVVSMETYLIPDAVAPAQ